MGKHRLSGGDSQQWGGPELAAGSEPNRHAAAVDLEETAPMPAYEDGGDPTAVSSNRPPG